MGITINIYHPKTWEQLEAQQAPSITEAATVNMDQLPQWLSEW
jgi:hypothetical protein